MGADHINPELFARWMQFGAVSAIMRTHTTKNGKPAQGTLGVQRYHLQRAP
jgi:alpha-glucosidase (family GH31 glycosyl hydrolase)